MKPKTMYLKRGNRSPEKIDVFEVVDAEKKGRDGKPLTEAYFRAYSVSGRPLETFRKLHLGPQDRLFQTRRELTDFQQKTNAKACWWISAWENEIVECWRYPDGSVYNERRGFIYANAKILYPTRALAVKALRAKLAAEANEKALKLKNLRAKIRRVK